MDATGELVTGIGRADVFIVAVGWFPGCARSVRTDVTICARISVIAGAGQQDVDTTFAGDAGVVRALI